MAVDPVADTPERAALRATVRRIVDTASPPERIAALDEAEAFDTDLFAALGAAGMFAVGAPTAVGGEGDVRYQLVVVEELGAGPTSMAAFAIGHFAVTQVLATYGRTDSQCDLATRMAAGSTRGAFALSEPAGGTDVARVMRTRAARDGDGWRLTGQKLWTSGATEAEAIVVLARTSPIERSPVHGVTMFLVPRHAPGVEVRTIETFGIRGCSTCEVFLDDVALAPDAVLGEVDHGMRQVFTAINREGLNATAACLGVGRAALALVTEHARAREVFGRPVGGFQAPQHGLVDGAVALESGRTLMWRAAEVEAAGGDAGVLASMAKLVASEAAVDLTLRGMQLMGGMGFTRGVAMQRYFRDVRLWSFSPLTNEMVRNRIGEQHLGLPRSY
jgi:alkylation response protein AidB-like acyl-CoA dehydrogenase